MESSHPGIGFYTIFMDDICKTELELPKNLKITLPNTVTIQDVYYNCWKVHTRRVGGSWYFLDGWEDFVKDNSLTTNDLLRFHYIGDGLFDVKLYGLSGCEEKKGVGHHKLNSITSNVIPDLGGSEQPRGRRKKVDWLGRDIFGDQVQKPDGLYFVRRFGAKRKNELYIPKQLLKDKNVILPPKLTLIDPEGRTFTTKFRQWYDARSFYIGGWRRLLDRNGITDDDICICLFDDEIRPKSLFVSFLKADRNT